MASIDSMELIARCHQTAYEDLCPSWVRELSEKRNCACATSLTKNIEQISKTQREFLANSFLVDNLNYLFLSCLCVNNMFFQPDGVNILASLEYLHESEQWPKKWACHFGQVLSYQPTTQAGLVISRNPWNKDQPITNLKKTSPCKMVGGGPVP